MQINLSFFLFYVNFHLVVKKKFGKIHQTFETKQLGEKINNKIMPNASTS
jgi:hypothetical protein